jgi:hypothetical protein
MPSQNLQTVLDGIPAAGQAALLTALGVGLVLWFFGRRLAKPVCALTGVALGAAAGFVTAQAMGATGLALAISIGGGVIGLILGALLFRLFMALSFAVVLAIALPAAALAWRGEAPPPVQTRAVQDQFVDLTRPPRSETQPQPTLHERLAAVYQQQREEARAWWDGLGNRQHMVKIAAGIGALAGLLVGLLLPRLAASVKSALLGGALMLVSAWQLLRLHAAGWAEHVPHGPRAIVTAVGLITILGVLVQWTLSRRKADR